MLDLKNSLNDVRCAKGAILWGIQCRDRVELEVVRDCEFRSEYVI
jgi:hypothetical protein